MHINATQVSKTETLFAVKHDCFELGRKLIFQRRGWKLMTGVSNQPEGNRIRQPF
ncbi:MAG: hypothetical protein LBE33_11055 [Zoogloeaceae bacterium]|nr:hypothetical protein [Zoogloeaceae bacterium]